jgi:hypothetical protein
MKGGGRPKCKWWDNIKIEVKEIECIQIAQNRIQLFIIIIIIIIIVMNANVP